MVLFPWLWTGTPNVLPSNSYRHENFILLMVPLASKIFVFKSSLQTISRKSTKLSKTYRNLSNLMPVKPWTLQELKFWPAETVLPPDTVKAATSRGSKFGKSSSWYGLVSCWTPCCAASSKQVWNCGFVRWHRLKLGAGTYGGEKKLDCWGSVTDGGRAGDYYGGG